MTKPILCACGCGESLKPRRYPSSYQARFINGHQHKGKLNGNYRGGKEKRACPICGTSFYEWPSQVKVTCGNSECYIQWQSLTTAARGQNKIAVSCDHCGRKLRRYPSLLNDCNYCNRFCMSQHHGGLISGLNNGRWKGGKWSFLQRQARIRDNQRCVICGFDLATDVHHLIPKSEGGTDDLPNLLTLCPNHHRLVTEGAINIDHLRREDWKPEDTATHPLRASR